MVNTDLIARNEELTNEVIMTIDLLTKIELLPDNGKHDALVRQFIRCSSSIGANYETASGSKSVGAFIDKIRKEEIDNTKAKEKWKILLTKANELLSIYSTTATGSGESKHHNYTHNL
jgi:hypothetical protein